MSLGKIRKWEIGARHRVECGVTICGWLCLPYSDTLSTTIGTPRGVELVTGSRPRAVIVVVAYDAERTIEDVLSRIPHMQREFETEVLVIDDASSDRTSAAAHRYVSRMANRTPVHVMRNQNNLRYGGTQKVGYRYAIDGKFDFVVLLHGDGQYAPECIPDLLEQLHFHKADGVIGSRMIKPLDALTGGMPVHKFIGNRILTFFQNAVLGMRLSEFHSGLRAYSVRALKSIDFERNTNEFHFDTEILIRMFYEGMRIVEIPIPTRYGNEKCHVQGLLYARDIFVTTVKAKVKPSLYQGKTSSAERLQ